jgi:hypothetical protein
VALKALQEYCDILQVVTQIFIKKPLFFTEGRQELMNDIQIFQIDLIPRPIRTPAGVVEKHFRATIQDFNNLGISIGLELQMRDADEVNGNRIIVERILIEQTNEQGIGVTGELLRKIPVQKLAEQCVLRAIDIFYPHTRTVGKNSLKVPTSEDVSKIKMVALISSHLGIKPPIKLIQEELAKQGINLDVGTIRNYRTKAIKAGLITSISSNNEIDVDVSRWTPKTMSEESDLISTLIQEGLNEGRPPISPQEHRRREKQKEEAALKEKERKDRAMKNKAKADLEKIKNWQIEAQRKAGK